MRPVSLPSSLLAQMRAHARETYPDEACGFLIGVGPDPTEPEARRILSVERAENTFDGERRRRFLIRPEELRDVERRAESTGRPVVGFYHSHPDHPARPSQFDQDHAWPWYTYVVLSVTASASSAVGAFELDADAAVFREVELRVEPESLSAPSVVEG